MRFTREYRRPLKHGAMTLAGSIRVGSRLSPSRCLASAAIPLTQ
jgi:hypothetical protein